MTHWAPWSLVLAAYLLGSVSFATLIARARGIDIRDEGSGNPGATNVSRVLGRGAGGLVLTLDLLKGFGPCLWAREWVGGDDVITSATGLAAILGHVAPLWHRFRGGKGVATAAGALLALVPVAGGAALGGYVVFRRVTRVASLASLAGTAIGAVVTAAWLGLRTWPTGMAAATFVIILVRHQSNLRRLAKGEEPRT